MLPEAGRDLILAGAILSILLNPLLFAMADRLLPPSPTTLVGHCVLVGYGRVGALVGAASGGPASASW